MYMKNQSQDMKTIVETFLIEETIDLIYDNEKLDKWNSLIDELGLNGQKEIVKQDKSPIPFMFMNQSIVNVAKQLCPRIVKVEDYNITPIPVEILDLISLSKRENYFNKIEIWYDDKQKDPFCIGTTCLFIPVDKEYKWYHDNKFNSGKECIDFLTSINKEPYYSEGGTSTDLKLYLLGKWADVKRSWAELIEMAKTRYINEQSVDFHKAIKEAKRGLEDLEIKAFEQFNCNITKNDELPF